MRNFGFTVVDWTGAVVGTGVLVAFAFAAGVADCDGTVPGVAVADWDGTAPGVAVADCDGTVPGVVAAACACSVAGGPAWASSVQPPTKAAKLPAAIRARSLFIDVFMLVFFFR